MILILATRGATTRLRQTPFTSTPIEAVHCLVYRVGIEPLPASGQDVSVAARGTIGRGEPRISGFVFSFDGSVAEDLLAISSEIDLVVAYRANGSERERTFSDVVFAGDATVIVPSLNRGISKLIGVPFRVQVPAGDAISDHITDGVAS